MSVNNEQLQNSANTVDNGATDAAPAAPAKHHYVADGFKNRTKGEAKFNEDTYIKIGYFGAIAASLGLTYLLKDNRFVAPQFKKLSDWIANSTKGNKVGEALSKHQELVDSYTTIGAMFTGTTLVTILPVKHREDKKPEIVKQNDIEIYGADRVANDPALQQAHKEIEESPKQTWKSVIGSRVVAFGATLLTSVVVGSNKSTLFKATGHSIDRESIRVGRWVNRQIARLTKNGNVLETIQHAAEHSPNSISRDVGKTDRLVSRIGSYLALDGLYTIITSGTLYVFTRLLGPIFDQHAEKRASENSNTTPAHSPATTTVTSPQPSEALTDYKINGIAHEGRIQSASPEHTPSLI